MPDFIKNAVDWLLGPTTFFFTSVLGLWAVIQFRAFWTQGWVAGSLAIFAIVFYALSLTDPDFVAIVGKADNVPISIMFFTVGFLLWLSFRKMVINDRLIAQGLPTFEAREARRRVYCWPDLVYGEFLCLIIVTVLLLAWAYWLPAPLEEPSNPARTPNPSKAPWYFLGLQEMLVYYDPWLAGVVFPTLIIVGLMAIPYIDFNPKGAGYYTFNERKFAIVTFLFGFVVLWVILIILGTFLRGPNWNFFGPYQFWDPHKVESLNNVNLSEYVYNVLLERALPGNILLRELPGILVILGYFAVLPPLLANFVFRGMYAHMGFIRFNVMANLLLWMAALPIKMMLRWVFNLKYIVAIPEFFYNI
ncbi:MAG TPA: hypothetical protein VMT52_18300 [Planctomycetota bacterium]|nr:hypothetical protein [Planctomycetota bacterium]